MDPLNINIRVNVSLDERTLQFLGGLLPVRQCDDCQEDMPAEICNPKPAPAPVREPAPKHEPDHEPEPEPEKPAEITDADLREKVKEAKDRKGAKAVRELFSEFGIGSSVECPQGRRSELVARLENL